MLSVPTVTELQLPHGRGLVVQWYTDRWIQYGQNEAKWQTDRTSYTATWTKLFSNVTPMYIQQSGKHNNFTTQTMA